MKHSTNATTGILAGSVSALLVCSPAAMAARFIPLGDLPGGSFESRALGVSADGSTVIGYSSQAAGTEAFRWTQSGGMQSLGVLPGAPVTEHSSYGSAVSADGSVIAGYGSSASGTVAFRWTQADGMTALGGVGANDGFTRADGISADGSVIVGYSATSAHPYGTAYRWTPESGMADLGTLSGDAWSWARGVSADGSAIVGQSNTFSGGQAFRWTAAEGMVSLGLAPGATQTSAGYISGDGSVIGGGGQVGGLSRAMIWTRGDGWENLGTLPGYQQSSNAGMSADGSMLVGQVFNFDQATSTFSSEGMIWDRSHGMRFADDWLVTDYGLNLAGWKLSYVSNISADGKVAVGYGINPEGRTEAWAADLTAVPLPPGLWLLGSGLLVLSRLRRNLDTA